MSRTAGAAAATTRRHRLNSWTGCGGRPRPLPRSAVPRPNRIVSPCPPGWEASGFADVFQARGRDNKKIAIKILKDEHATDSNDVARFEREKEAEKVDSEYAVKIYGIDKLERAGELARPYLVMELVEGESRSDQAPPPRQRSCAAARRGVLGR